MTSATERLVPLSVTTEEAYFPPKKHQSSEIIVAATKLNFKHKEIKQQKEDGAVGEDDAEAKDAYEKEYIRHAQNLDKIQIAEMWKTDLKSGLTEEQFKAAQEEYGFNELTPKPQLHWTLKLLKSIFDGEFNILLWFGASLCFIMYAINPLEDMNLFLGIVLAFVVTVTGIFGYVQESKSSDIMESFKTFESNTSIVTREGNPKEVPPRELVPGDLVSLKAGDKIPADIRITACSSDAQVNNASLTGESDAQDRSWAASSSVPLEAKNMCFFGTLMMRGNLQGVVVASGDRTFMGTVAKLAQDTATVETPIAKEIRDFVKKISAIAFLLGISFFAVGMWRTKDLVSNVIFLIGIIVANVPEGLLATVTLSLTLTANRMGKKNVQVKNLESVETLGSTSVICSDKTGTLTTSIMTVQHVVFDLEAHYCDTKEPWSSVKTKKNAQFYDDDGKVLPSFARLLRIGILCNNAKELPGKQIRQVVGDATESAMYKFCDGHIKCQSDRDAIIHQDTRAYRLAFEKLHEIPFNSSNKWQVSIHRQVAGSDFNADEMKENFNQRPVVVLKGAPEKVMAMCDRYLNGGEVEPLTDEVKLKIMAEQRKLAEKGERVLGFADLELDEEKYNIYRPPPPLSPHKKEQLDPFDGVYVMYNGSQIQVHMNCEKDGQPLPFEQHKFRHIYNSVAAHEDVQQKDACIYLTYGEGEGTQGPAAIERHCTLEDMDIPRGAVIHAYLGPYNFEGTGRDEANWPFGRDDEEGLVFVGMYAMIDPARSGVPEAVKSCQQAGIKVIMVTGDHPVTAHAIAKDVGIIAVDPKTGEHHKTKQDVARERYGGEENIAQVDIDDPEYRASLVPGQKSKDTIPGWTVQEKEARGVKDPVSLVEFWNEVLTKDSVVFARTSPEQKLKIVQACQERGGVVAVTGDGVNDSPALKKADIGVAMGITGTEVAKESADMILKDDNFASIVSGVKEGRIIFDNLKKSIAYTLSSNIPEIAPFLVNQLFMVPLPLTTVMILMVDLGTDLAPAISLAHEGAEADIMTRAPRDQKKDNLVTARLISFSYLQIGCIQALGGFYAYLVVLWGYGFHPSFLPNLDEYYIFSKRSVHTNLGRNAHIDGYWLYCYEGSHPCTYSPDPTVFKCNFDVDVWDRTADTIEEAYTAEVGECSTPDGWTSRDPKTDKFYGNFKDWYNSEDGWVVDMIGATNRIMEEHLESDEGAEWQAKYDLWKDPSTSERELYRIYSDFLYNVMPDYTYKTDVVKARSCQETTFDVGAATTNPDSGPDHGFDCTKVEGGTKDWPFWKEENQYCTALNICYGDEGYHGVVATTEEAMDTPGTLFPMQLVDRHTALAASNTAYFISIIVVQWADLMICKTRSRSLFEQGMTNVFMNYSLFFETALGACLVYLPFLNDVFSTRPLKFVWWTSAIPFSIFIYVYDELRKGYIRRNRGCWLERNTYW